MKINKITADTYHTNSYNLSIRYDFEQDGVEKVKIHTVSAKDGCDLKEVFERMKKVLNEKLEV